MLKNYIEKYKESDRKSRLQIIKYFLSLMFPQYDFSPINNYDVIFTRDKFQFFIDKECVCALRGESPYMSELWVYAITDKLEVNTDSKFTNIIFELLDIEDAHR